MKTLASVVVATLAGGAAAFVVIWCAGAGHVLSVVSDRGTASGLAAAEDGAVSGAPRENAASPSVAPARFEGSVGELSARVGELERRLAALEATAGRRPAEMPSTAVVDEAALQRAVETVAAKKEQARYDGLSEGEMLAEVRRLQYEAKDPLGARRALDVLLSRELKPQERARALTELGILQRRGDLAASAATLQQVVDSQGLGSELGSAAAYQLIWTTWRDRKAALRLADVLARDGSGDWRLHARWCAAMLAQEQGDAARARADYAAILRDCGGRPEYQGVAEDVRKRLAGLDGR